MQIAFALIIVAGLVLAIWQANKAKPVGNLPYHWGAFQGVMVGLVGLSALVDTVRAAALSSLVLLINYDLVFIAACVGLLMRRRFGAVAFLAILIINIVIEISQNAEVNIPRLAGQLFVFCLNFIYFGRRWEYLSAPAARMPKA